MKRKKKSLTQICARFCIQTNALQTFPQILSIIKHIIEFVHKQCFKRFGVIDLVFKRSMEKRLKCVNQFIHDNSVHEILHISTQMVCYAFIQSYKM